MNMETTTIQISKHVKKKLDELKKRNGHTSYDSVLRYLLHLENPLYTFSEGKKCLG